MKLEAKLGRIQLNNLPLPIAERLWKRRDFATLIDADSADIPGVGQVSFGEVRNAILAAPLDTFVNVSGAGASGICVARTQDALFRVRAPSGIEVSSPELSLLDPSTDIRLKGIRYLSERALPNWPCALRWQKEVLEAPLASSDFGLVLDELSHVGDVVIDGILQKLQSAKFAVLDVIPTSTTYYESLLGPIPWSLNASQYVSGSLAPHLTDIFNKSPHWGLRCVQAASISEAVDAVAIAVRVSNDDLYSAFMSVGFGSTPSALLATYTLASSRASVDERFTEVSRQALNRLMERTCGSEDTSAHDALLIALVKLTMSVVGQAEKLGLAPAFWRRLAAFAHATIILEAIHIADEGAIELAAWFAKCLTLETAAIQVLDHLAEPRWGDDAIQARKLWASALLRTTQSESGSNNSATLSSTEFARAEPYLRYAAGIPDPLNSTRRDWATSAADTLTEELLDSINTENSDGESLGPMNVWMVLAQLAQSFRFEDGLLLRIRDLVRTLTPKAETKFRDVCAMLELCGIVASTQGDLELAEAVATQVLEFCEELTDPADVSLAALVLVFVAGAAEDQPAGLQWASEKLLALAYRLPRGVPCSALATTIAKLQQLIPLDERRWGKAMAVASSAVG